MASIYVDEISGLIVEAYLKNPKQNLGFLGPVGVGKTDEVHHARNILASNLNDPAFFLNVVILSQRSAEDFTIPWPDAENAKKGIYGHLTHSDWVYEKDAKGIIFLDEALNAAGDTTKSSQNILSSREINGKKLGDGIMLVLASNRKEDRAGVNSINTAFGNRVEWHEVEIHFEGWEKWAREKGLDISIIGFLKKFRQHLYDFKSDRMINATPRTWAKVNEVIGSKWEFARISGLVGEGIATEFSAYRRLFSEFPEISDINLNPAKAKMPKDKDAQFALANALASWTTKEYWPNFVKYVERMDQEYKFMFMKEAARLHPEFGLKNTSQWTNYIVTNQKDLI